MKITREDTMEILRLAFRGGMPNYAEVMFLREMSSRFDTLFAMLDAEQRKQAEQGAPESPAQGKRQTQWKPRETPTTGPNGEVEANKHAPTESPGIAPATPSTEEATDPALPPPAP